MADDVFREDDFLKKVVEVDWSEYQDQSVLIRGCQGVVVPPWAFMYLTGQLAPFARVVRYGNEHDHIVVFRAARK